MKTFFIIYIIGCIASFIIGVKIRLDKYSQLTVWDIEIAFFESLFSWLSLIGNLLNHYEKTVIYKKKDKNN